MNIIISNSSDVPIYEQIKAQIKNMIMTGELKSGDALPGMRSLAKDLKVSVITTKRAYNDLESEGFIYTSQGKGSFVSTMNSEIVKEENLKLIEEELSDAVKLSYAAGISLDELIEILSLIYRGE
ncbi:GntR family transcriptional regulator [Anaerosphaera aminiphila DSM 21120]|uniref:GntR family transcriptional regulator n=1 Tax=Anaerosphaera aminiphila DSM 21120 TaxID=1120995 RepID=A0A1M5UQZ1_9FIRM|nr:GntR family transcriptional regulator [Anaerosphaera aminiphila]SHH65399.1 GntR family transcriptional regulator [Anaerosphaera aminiphila DSM 21120]